MATRARELDRRFEVAALQVADESRRAQQIGDELTLVTHRVEPEVIGRARIAPLDALLRIEQHDAVGRSVDGSQELTQALALGRCLLLAPAQGLLDAVAGFAPKTGVSWRRLRLRAAQPLQQTIGAQRIDRGGQCYTRSGTQSQPKPRETDQATHNPTDQGARRQTQQQGEDTAKGVVHRPGEATSR